MTNEEQKLSYEELQNAANGLVERNRMLTMQCNKLAEQVRALSEMAAFKRLDYLFKIVEMDFKFPSDFVISCTDEIVKTMTFEEKEDKEGTDTKEEEA